jgi:hypothetical protein
MMRKAEILQVGASIRADVVRAYTYHGTEGGQVLVKRVTFEMGELLSDMHGRREAAAALYEIADKITCHLPLDDFRAPPAAVTAESADPAPQAEPPKAFAELSWAGKAGRVCGKVIGLATDRFCVGFVLGLMARSGP